MQECQENFVKTCFIEYGNRAIQEIRQVIVINQYFKSCFKNLRSAEDLWLKTATPLDLRFAAQSISLNAGLSKRNTRWRMMLLPARVRLRPPALKLSADMSLTRSARGGLDKFVRWESVA